MLVAAVFPTASELVMLYAGALASGAFATAHGTAFGSRIDTPAWAFLAVAITGVAADTIAGVGGWPIGSLGGRPGLARCGRWLQGTAAARARGEGTVHHH